jgi:hypothetical protein
VVVSRTRLLIGLLAAAVAAAVIVALRPELLLVPVGAVRSPRAIAVTLGILAALAGLWLLLRRFVASPLARSLVLAVPALAIAWFMIAPAFRDVRVDEELPVVAPGSAAPAAPAAPMTLPSEPAEPAAPAPPPEPVRLGGGSLTGIDHRATGGAALYRLSDGSHVLRLEDIDVQNGPDYLVYLVPGGDAQEPDGGIGLGPLQANLGSHNYPLPGPPPPGPLTLLIWCRAFGVPIANAPVA